MPCVSRRSLRCRTWVVVVGCVVAAILSREVGVHDRIGNCYDHPKTRAGSHHGGGRGTRLSPLTLERCKPAVPLAGKYRLVDIPISNCLNSDVNRIFLLTQFNTASLH